MIKDIELKWWIIMVVVTAIYIGIPITMIATGRADLAGWWGLGVIGYDVYAKFKTLLK